MGGEFGFQVFELSGHTGCGISDFQVHTRNFIEGIFPGRSSLAAGSEILDETETDLASGHDIGCEVVD